MKIADAFAPDVTTRDFFERVLPALHDAFREDVEHASEVDLIISVYLQDSDERWTIRRDHERGELEVENDEMIDFPHLTIIGQSKFWPVVKKRAIPMLERLEKRRDELRGQFKITTGFLKDFEDIDGVIDVEITGEGEAVSMSFVLNNYDPEPAYPRFGVSLALETLNQIANGDVQPDAAARSLSISGDKRFAIDLGGLIMTHVEKQAK